MCPGAGLIERGVSGAVGDALHHPCQIAAEVAHGLAALRVHLDFTGAHAVNHVPVERADERLVIVGDVLVEAVECGRGTSATGHGNGGTGLVGQLAAGGVVQAIEQGTERAVGAGEVGGAADNDGIYLIEHVVNGVVKLIVHTAAAGFQTTTATDAPLNGLGSDLEDFSFGTAGAKSLCYHTEGVKSITVCIGTAINKKSFHTL